MSGIIVYEGPSRLDPNATIVVILTGLDGSSSNSKTGGMVQSYIIRTDRDPMTAVNDGSDRAICGECPHRKQADGSRSCYVTLAHGPSAVYRAFLRGNYERCFPELAARRIAGRALRMGTYGDPAAVPVDVWLKLTQHVAGWTGYTHQWRRASELRLLTMASVDSDAEREQAHAAGWRTFRVRRMGLDGPQPLDASEIVCPASIEAGHRVTCETCGLCKGASRTAKSIAIIDHSTSALAKRRRLAVVQQGASL